MRRRYTVVGGAIALALVIAIGCGSVAAQDPPLPTVQEGTAEPQEAADSADAPEDDADLAAETYLIKCSGCHTIGAGPRTGPDLQAAIGWPTPQLRAAVERMQEKTGPLPPEEVAALLELLQGDDLPARLARQEERIAQRFAAKLDAPSAAEGSDLFHGGRALEHGGMACSACHRAGGRGGSLAPDLTLISQKLAGIGLVSACEGANFPVMRTAYRDHPVTKQEAVHLARYLEELATPEAVASGPSEDAAPLILLGVAVFAIGLFGVTFRSRRPRLGVRARLVRTAYGAES